MRFGSVCSGIEAASVAWNGLGWKAAWFSEIEQFPSAVLNHHYPEVTNLGDMTKFKEWNLSDPIDILVGGTPCQSFSVAGLRKGLDDPRGNLMLTYLGILDKFRPKWCVWENVPGVLSSNGGRDFGSFLGSLAQLGYGFAYRVLDAQNFRVPQRRRRVFVVGCLGDWRNSAEALFESESLRGDIKKSRKTGENTSKCLTAGVGTRLDGETDQFVISSGVAYSFDSLGSNSMKSPNTFSGCNVVDVSRTLDTSRGLDPGCNQGGMAILGAQTLQARRLTPMECERLQGFPDNYTDIMPKGKPTPDCPRYKALGNSMAVPVMKWIGERIKMVEEKINV